MSIISARTRNKVRMYLYSPRKSRLNKAYKSISELNKKLGDGITGLMEDMGFEAEKNDEKDTENKK